ncbi:MAG: 3,4-dehydroadipyl-CoA semialdehyde dehydrogenase [Pigmentiphaga sp.]|nr:3,4-dehydroadipyl-CoA semialdehyde dehydrogenase [Pigmentiphaga sp.]
MTQLLPNYLAGQWQTGTDAGTTLRDPVLGTDLVRVSSAGLDLAAGFDHARRVGGPALRALSYAQRAALLGRVAEVLQANRDAYFEIATANSGTTQTDSAIDIDGGIFTLSYYARQGQKLGDGHYLPDGDDVRLAKDEAFQTRHIQTPLRGVALFINAFNFPSWGLWEKAAPALLSGVPVVIKPATATAWLTQRMVADVIEAGILPPGALSIVCGSPAGLLEAVAGFDLVSFTGSTDTAATIRMNDNVARQHVRINAEADSLNSAILGPDATPGTPAFDLLVKEVVREMTGKAGQKCTAIRRIFVPESVADAAAEAIAAQLARIKVGNPRNPEVRMGSLASHAQQRSVLEGLAVLQRDAETVYAGNPADLIDASADVGAFVMPHLLRVRDADTNQTVHDHEVFGPVATLVPYRDEAHAVALAQRGLGSLVSSLYGDDPQWLGRMAVALADTHGRVHVITPAVGKTHTGHGNVMPMSVHGGPGRAGGGEELGGMRALALYHRRTAVQAHTDVLGALPA